jgi:hypothetical protein
LKGGFSKSWKRMCVRVRSVIPRPCRPRARSADHAARILVRNEAADPIGDRFQGGGFCTQEFDHDPGLAGPGAAR